MVNYLRTIRLHIFLMLLGNSIFLTTGRAAKCHQVKEEKMFDVQIFNKVACVYICSFSDGPSDLHLIVCKMFPQHVNSFKIINNA